MFGRFNNIIYIRVPIIYYNSLVSNGFTGLRRLYSNISGCKKRTNKFAIN